VKNPSHMAQKTREEAKPHGAEDADDGRHADRRSHLASFAAVTLTRRTRCMLSSNRRSPRPSFWETFAVDFELFFTVQLVDLT